jgi:CheY-like chemotaxis protein
MPKKILLADDEEDILTLVAATLGDSDRYALVLASDGEEALKRAQDTDPDLIFLDAMMPKMDGYEVCERLKSNSATAHIKVVMLTALAQEADKQRAEQAGVDSYFSKPFSPTMLLEKVDELLATSGTREMRRHGPDDPRRSGSADSEETMSC